MALNNESTSIVYSAAQENEVSVLVFGSISLSRM
jgi:hypothetical protein